jgi:enoyl-[acyl-carrier protein] reductase / trans-2-enoyl-CoA reductase (NAD+)
MIIHPKVRGFVCVTSHPDGCAAHVQEQIDFIRQHSPLRDGPRKVLVIGASTGYGLSSRIAAAFGSGAGTLGVFFERPPAEDKPATAGWYNSAAFERAAHAEGLYARSINGDAFSHEVKQQVIETIVRDLGSVDLVIYSLASPRRTHPLTGEVHRSVIKPIGQRFTNKTVDIDKGFIHETTLEPATPEEVTGTVAVMGGEDWEMWIEALEQAGVLAPGATTLAYSYIGPELTWPIYHNGTIGRAKADLDQRARRMDAKLKATGGRAFVSVNKAVVTQASSAIPVVPLYIALLFKVMKAKGIHEGCIEQIQRLFSTQMYQGHTPAFDEAGRVRVDDWEMRSEVQEEVERLWNEVTTENLTALADLEGYRSEFLKLFGFGLPGVDYDRDVDLAASLNETTGTAAV